MSGSWLARTVVAMSLAIATPLQAQAQADETPIATIVVGPAECGEFWSIPGGLASPVAWDALLSFASCIQDRRLYPVAHADELEGLVARLNGALAPSLELFEAALEEGPPTIQFRAAYHVGLGQVALLTRARASVADPALGPELERLLEPNATLAYFVFTTIDRAVAQDPSLTPDAVTRYMARSSHALAAALRKRWRIPPGDDDLRIAQPR